MLEKRRKLLDSSFSEEDFVLIMPNRNEKDDLLIGTAPVNAMHADNQEPPAPPDWHRPVRRFYQELANFARFLRREIEDIYPQIRLSVYFNRVDLGADRQNFNTATFSFRSTHLEGRSDYYPDGKQRFADFHIERSLMGFTTRQVFYIGNIDNKASRAAVSLAAKFAKKIGGSVDEEVGCQSIISIPSRTLNLEASDFSENMTVYLKMLDRRHFLAEKIRTKLHLKPAKPKWDESEAAALEEVLEVHREIRQATKPWFKRREKVT